METRVRQAVAAEFGEVAANTATYTNLGGHASLRIYWRVDFENAIERAGASTIAMVMPLGEDALKSDEGGDQPPATELPFSAVQKYLQRIGCRVPTIFYENLEIGVLLLEDLGTTMFENVLLDNDRSSWVGWYKQALDVLIDFQKRVLADDDRSCLCWDKSFDASLLRWELDHYTEWGIEARHETDVIGALRPAMETAYTAVVEELEALPQTLVLRDYQSRNIMRTGDEWVLIDFQDALTGPYIYDVVALLRDSYVALNPDEIDELIAYYAGADLPWCTSVEAVSEAFHTQTLQRKLKDAGRFIYIDQVKGNPDFLPYFEPSRGYVRNAIAKLGLNEPWTTLVDL